MRVVVTPSGGGRRSLDGDAVGKVSAAARRTSYIHTLTLCTLFPLPFHAFQLGQARRLFANGGSREDGARERAKAQEEREQEEPAIYKTPQKPKKVSRDEPRLEGG